MNDDKKEIYMVARLGGGSPSHNHATIIDATKEATRLAEKHPGSTFYILKALGMITSKVVLECQKFD